MDNDQADPAELAALRAAYGAEGTGSAALGWEAVHDFEAGHAVVLPEPYRTFVAEIADGCRSGPPEYGLLPLAQLPDDWSGDGRLRDLGRPFPLTAAWIWEEDPGQVADLDATLERVHHHGTVVLGTDGCAMDWHLVVSGPHRGHVWLITDVGAAPFGGPPGDPFGFPLADPGFASWALNGASPRP
ncbi:SMI1/KNR4 family protein [Streptomyces sp. cmx-4-9]|uniref:SMI1/KNR4 family protein n=1 Tax=Streptomyces sp. cmx-4-9 TaxID=2790941 RepID=UPI0039816B57